MELLDSIKDYRAFGSSHLNGRNNFLRSYPSCYNKKTYTSYRLLWNF